MKQLSTKFPVQELANLKSDTERAELLRNPVFGKVFTDHMVMIDFSDEKGWHDPQIVPHGDFSFAPASMTLHYALEIFEGMKVYRQPDGGATLFRPGANAKRFQNSAHRLAMEPLPEELFLQSVRDMAILERNWIPSAEGSALYLRPFQFATEVKLGTVPARSYRYCVIACPVGNYFKAGAAGLKLWVSETFTRAGPGGTGAAKCGGNYAASLAAQAEGLREGCEQAIFLDAVERKWIEEMGGMNVFFVFNDGSIQTPPLGTILPGVTRDSLLTIARDMGMTAREELYSIDEWQADAKSGRLTEAFACGTAAVVTPIGQVEGKRHSFKIGDGVMGPVTHKLKSALLDIQYGRSPDKFNWLDRLF